MICGKCGKYNGDNASRCAFCGARFTSRLADRVTAQIAGREGATRPLDPQAMGYGSPSRKRHAGSIVSIAVPVCAICVAFAFAIGITVWMSGGGASEADGQVNSALASSASASSAAEPSASAQDGVVVHNADSTTGTSTKSYSSGSSDTLTEEEFYQKLTSAYTEAGKLNTKLASCITAFNANILKESKEIRQSSRQEASSLRQTISSAETSLKNLKVPYVTDNQEAWEDLCELYECLYKRVDVLVQSWDKSLNYEKPAEHETEVLKPIRAQQDSSGNDIYYKRYKELYPTIEIVKPSKEIRGL